MNILLTGATGFIGKNLLPALEREGHEVFVLVRPSSNYGELGARHSVIFSGDVLHLAQYIQQNKIEGIIHLASLYLAEHKPEQIPDLIQSNICLGTQLLETCKIAKVKWFLNTGTIWQNYNVSDYSDEYCPVNLYAATKQAFIDMAKYYIDVFGIRFCTLKLCDTYGSNDTRRKIFKLFKDYSESGEMLKMSPGEQLIDIVYITDIIAGFTQLVELLASDTELADEYVLTSGHQIPLKELAQLFCKVSGRNLNIEWGGRSYRDREVMIPWKGTPVPGWKAKIDAEKGIRLFLDIQNVDNENVVKLNRGGYNCLIVNTLPASVYYSEAA